MFEAVDCSTDFPLGCKTTYRAYSKDEVVEIYQQDTPEFPGINLRPRKCIVTTYPKENIDKGVPSGMYILQSLPPSDRELLLCPFISNSKELLDEVIADIKKTFGRFQSEVVANWEKWAELYAPKNNHVDDYLKT